MIIFDFIVSKIHLLQGKRWRIQVRTDCLASYQILFLMLTELTRKKKMSFLRTQPRCAQKHKVTINFCYFEAKMWIYHILTIFLQFLTKINQSEVFFSLIGKFSVTKCKIGCHFSHVFLWQFYFSLCTVGGFA